MLGLLETSEAPDSWERLYRREMALKKMAIRKRIFDKVRLTPTSDQITVIEGFAYQPFQFHFRSWPEVSNGTKRTTTPKPRGDGSADGGKRRRKSQLTANTADIRRASGKGRVADWQSAESWKKQHEAARRSELRKTVRPLPTFVAGPCGPAPEDGQSRRITIWDNRLELEQFCNFGDFTRVGRLGFQAGVIHKCGTFIVITDITARFKHHPLNPKLELKYGYAKYNCERASKGTDPEFPWDNPPTNRVQLASLISRYPHRARAAEYMVDDKFFTTDDDADGDDDTNPTTPTRDTDGTGDQPGTQRRGSLIEPTSIWVDGPRRS